MSIEQQIRAVMLTHETDLPDVPALTVPPIGGANDRRWHPQVAAWSLTLLILAGVLSTFSLHIGTHHRTGTGTATPADLATGSAAVTLSCPAALPPTASATPWVPALPRGIDGAARLVPATLPIRALICAYIAPHSPAGSTGSVLLSGNLTGVMQKLFWQPPAPHALGGCTDNLTPTDADRYLLGLTYPAGTEWIAAPADHCQGASNGVFSTTHNMSAFVSAWYAAKRWIPSSPSTSACDPAGTGRYGQQTSIVPAGPVSVSVCAMAPDGGNSTQRTVGSGFSALVSALNRLPTSATTSSCQPQPQAGPERQYNLLFSYPVGPPALVSVTDNCLPAIDNGNLQADDAATVLPLIRDLLPMP